MQIAVGIIYVAVTYFYFLIFAQFAFLELVKASVGLDSLQTIMAAMGIAGLLSSLATYLSLKRIHYVRLLRVGLIGCGSSAALATLCGSVWVFHLLAAMIGVFLGLLTVVLSSSLLKFFSPQKIGIFAGLGTAFAYSFSNAPYIFHAGASLQSGLAAAACIVCSLLPVVSLPNSSNLPRHFSNALPRSYLWFLASFLALVWFDSAAFFVIQQNTQLKAYTWASNYSLYLNASIHFIFAIIAGLAIDKGNTARVLVLSFLCLLVGVAAVQEWILTPQFASLWYCAGVSLYSTALVTYPSLCSEANASGEKVALRAALLYAIAGWFGSAMGIGMAQDLHAVPLAFVFIAGTVIGATAYVKGNIVRGAVVSCLLLSSFCVVTDSAQAQSATSVEELPQHRGRRVYIQEGCINCHSQYVRPLETGVKDVEMWGPYVDYQLILADNPPLIGNRRVGPDLLNVGIRRNYEWLKLHLIYPELFTPGSVMPSYKHLFESSRGEDLLAYLLSLGATRLVERLAFTQQWKVASDSVAIPISEASLLYRNACAQCHGEKGRGDGEIAAMLQVRPRDLSYFPKKLDQASRDYFARVVKFGLPGRTMPGHEHFTDAEVLGVVEYLTQLVGTDD